MNRLRGMKQSWIWKKEGVIYKATLYNNVFTIRTGNTGFNGNRTILKIRGLTLESQNTIIKNMNKTRLSLESDE